MDKIKVLKQTEKPTISMTVYNISTLNQHQLEMIADWLDDLKITILNHSKELSKKYVAKYYISKKPLKPSSSVEGGNSC
jgi:hypothetical protein